MATRAALLAFLPGSVANDNGLAELPPMGWRSWNLYGDQVNQELIEGVMDGMVSKKRSVDGVPTSLCDLGYCDVGLDDNWQNCDAGAGNNHYHDADGNPVINYDRFPDMKKMVDHAHSLGLTAGWYGNNCICADHDTSDRKFYEGDAKKLREFGFDGYKLDGCGAQLDMQLWDDIFKADGGKPVMVENCHWGSAVPFEPNATWCPWNFYRTSGDVRASYASVMGNLNSVSKFNSRNLSYPGCWAYPDMLEVGCQHGPGGASDPGLSVAETRTHFGAWVIVSSPLTLSHDVNNDTIMDAIWPVIANKEVIAVSQTYAGYSGGVFKSSSDLVQLSEVNFAAMERHMDETSRQSTGPTLTASFQYLYKPLAWDGSKTAVLLLNSGDAKADLTLTLADVPGMAGPCDVRDIWEHKDLGNHKSDITVSVESHDAAFLVLSGCTPQQLVI
jgi:alpha-galactosidase